MSHKFSFIYVYLLIPFPLEKLVTYFSRLLRRSLLIAESRAAAQARVISAHLEHDMELLGLTGVEDRLQDDVRGTLECMRNAGGTLPKAILLLSALCFDLHFHFFYLHFRFVGLASGLALTTVIVL